MASSLALCPILPDRKLEIANSVSRSFSQHKEMHTIARRTTRPPYMYKVSISVPC